MHVSAESESGGIQAHVHMSVSKSCSTSKQSPVSKLKYHENASSCMHANMYCLRTKRFGCMPCDSPHSVHKNTEQTNKISPKIATVQQLNAVVGLNLMLLNNIVTYSSDK